MLQDPIKILIVDDQAEQRDVLKLILQDSGYEIFLAENASKALSLFSATPFPLVISDIQLPDFSGLELLQRIKRLNEDVIFIVVTGHSDPQKTMAALQFGAFDYLIKPVSKEQLLLSIQNGLKKSQNLSTQKTQHLELQRNMDEISETLHFQKEALEREQQRTQGIIESAHIGFLVLDAESDEVFLLNQKGRNFLRVIDSCKQAYLLRSYQEIFPDKIVEILNKIVSRIQKEKRHIDFGQYEFSEESIYHFAGYPILIGDSLSSIVIVVEDITEKIVLEKQILQSSRLADIGELAAVVGHEINNPIAFVISNMQSLSKYIQRISEFFEKFTNLQDFLSSIHIDERTILDAYQGILNINDQIQSKAKEMQEIKEKAKLDTTMKNINDIIQENLQGLDRVKRIVQDLKNLSFMGEDNIEESDINKIIQDAIEMLWNQIRYKTEIVRRYNALPLIKCFPRQISQVFTNLIINASQAIDQKGVITIKTLYENQTIQIHISDNGNGMDEQTQKKLFTPFFTTKKIGKGTGLGLSISQKIIEKHKGKIQVKSELGKGTTFSISLPLNGVEKTGEKL